MNNTKLAPAISIVVPIYGVEKYLRQCLDSIVAQTFKEFECILVDDGSKDGCPAICDEYAAREHRFKVIHKQNAGYGAAVNTGLAVARGEWIGIVEPDDWIDRDMYKLLTEEARRNNVDVVKSGFDTFYDSGKTSWSICFSKESIPKAVFKLEDMPELLKAHPSIWACIYRNEFLKQHCLQIEESPGATWQDNLFQVQTLVYAKSIAYVSTRLYHYRLFENKPLRDSAMPLRRSLQIHDWLKSVGYDAPAAMMALLAREAIYIRMSIQDAKFKDLPQLAPLITKLLRSQDLDEFYYKRFVGIRTRSALYVLKVMPIVGSLWIKLDVIHKIGNFLRMLHLRRG